MNITNSVKSKIARRAAMELEEGQIVNLGVGIPGLIPDYIKDINVYLQSENGLLGIGSAPDEEDIDPDLINASKQPITMQKGASIFSSSASFAMIRGGHVDMAIMGGLQIDQTGEIANWSVPGKDILGVGGAMDLIAGAKKIVIAMTHQSKNGESKLVEQLTFNSSGSNKADMVITEKAVFKFEVGRMILVELAPGTTMDELKASTEAKFEISEELKTYQV